jgi:hypothetical protein
MRLRLGVLASLVVLVSGCGSSGPPARRTDARVTGVFQSCIALAPCRPVRGYVEVQDSNHRVVARQRVDGRYTFALVPGQYMLVGQELTRCTTKAIRVCSIIQPPRSPTTRPM